MDDAVGWVVALGVSFFVFRYFFSSSEPARRRAVPQASIDTVHSMFPHIPLAAVRYELERTGSVEGTVERCLRDGRLPEPPAGLFTDPLEERRVTTVSAVATTSTVPVGKPTSLIAKLGLQARVKEVEVIEGEVKGKGKAPAWETSVEGREKSLKERKAKMVLDARRKLLAKEAERKTA